MSKKLEDLMIENFAKVTTISVSFDKNLTYIIGENGSGKTTAGLNAVWFLLKGLAQKGDGLIAERFRFIGPTGKSAKVIGNIYDEVEDVKYKVSRKLLKNKTELKIEASDGRQLDQAWLDSIFNPFLIDPMGFSKLSGKDQALAFGADTSAFDLKKKEVYQERLLIGRDVERLQGVVDTAIKSGVEKIEAVDVKGLMEQLEVEGEKSSVKISEVYALDRMKEDLAGKKIRSTQIKAELEETIKKLKDSIKMYNDGIESLKIKIVDKERVVAEMPDGATQEIREQIESAQEVNLKATKYVQFRENESALDDTKLDYEGKTDKIRGTEADRTKYLKSLKLPWPNITINNEGEFRLNDKPFCSPYFSTGEILKLSTQIASKLNPDAIKYAYIPSSNIMDDKNREAIFKTMVKEGFQVVAEYISTEKIPEQSCILLKEMKVVESYDESAGAGLK